MSKTNEIIKLKELLDMGAISKEEYDIQKRELLNRTEKPKSKVFKVIGIIAISFVGLIIVLGIIGSLTSNDKEKNSSQQIEQSSEKEPENPDFANPMPIEISGKMDKDILGFPLVSFNIKNTTDKDILAMQFYFVPQNVYGETVDSMMINNKLEYTDCITVGTSQSINFQIIDNDVKFGTAYLYSIYYSDKTEWGNKNASKDDIMKYAYKINIK